MVGTRNPFVRVSLIPHDANVGDSASWPGDVGYSQHMNDPLAMDQDADARALWQSHTVSDWSLTQHFSFFLSLDFEVNSTKFLVVQSN
jgi:hypothetical protein